MGNWYTAVCKALLKACMNVLISVSSLFGFFVYAFYALVGLFTVKGFATDVQGFSFGAEPLRHLATCAFYLVLVPVDLLAVLLYPVFLLAKDLEWPCWGLLELFGFFPADAQLEQNTRFAVPRASRAERGRRLPEVLGRMAACACCVAGFALLLQRNAPGSVVLGLLFRARLQEAVAGLNQRNQSLLTQVAWVNEFGRTLEKLAAADMGLAGDLERVEVRTEAAVPWLARFRADQLRLAAAFLPGIGPATTLVSANFRLGEGGRFRGVANLVQNCLQFAACLLAVWWALFRADTRAGRGTFWAVFGVYVLVTLPEFFDDVQDFTLEGYRLRWKEAIDGLFCRKKGQEKSQQEPLVGTGPDSYTLEPAGKESGKLEEAEEGKAAE